MKISILVPVPVLLASAALPFAGLVRHSGAHRLWLGQGMVVDSYQVFTHLVAHQLGVPAGSGVALAPLRHPLDTAIQLNTVSALLDQPLVAGFGTGSRQFQQDVLGRAWESPLTAMREYLMIVRGLLEGREVDLDGRYFTAHARLLSEVRAAPVSLGLGVLRPRMAELAGEVADTAITWLASPNYLADVIGPALDRGAERAGRDRPQITAVVPVAGARPGRDVREVLWNGSRAHLAGPHYRDMLRRGGAELSDDPVRDAGLLLDHGVFVGGDEQDVLAGIDRFEQAGVDELVLNITGVGMGGIRPAVEEMVALLTTLGLDRQPAAPAADGRAA